MAATSMPAEGVDAAALIALVELLGRGPITVLTGAGCSTESGIPDYRGPTSRHRDRQPMRYQEFTRDAVARQRYWARSFVGWPRIAGARPNAAHRAIAAIDGVELLITQNVDGLHGAAGSRDALELHGSLHWVVCLHCGARESREALQARMKADNPGFGGDDRAGSCLAPDGDSDLPPEVVAGFRPPACDSCGGLLKPDVVFFGENVPRPRVERAVACLDRSAALLVVGSSLTVYSGYRFVRRAAERGIPVAIVNLGPTRGDALATLRLEARAGLAMTQLATLNTARSRRGCP